jgi:hypothetical protein
MEMESPVFVEDRRIDVAHRGDRQLIGICTPENAPGAYETIFRLRQSEWIARDEIDERETLTAVTRWLLARGAEDLDASHPDVEMLGRIAPEDANEPEDSDQPQDANRRSESSSPEEKAALPKHSVDHVAGGDEVMTMNAVIGALFSLDRLENEIIRITANMREIRGTVLQALTHLSLGTGIETDGTALDGPELADIPVTVHADTPISIAAYDLVSLIDVNRLEIIRAETKRAQDELAMLDEADAILRMEPEVVPEGTLPTGVRELATLLISADQHDLNVLRHEAVRLGLVPLEAVRRINEWAQERSDQTDAGVDSPVLEVDEKAGMVWVDDYLKELLT